MDISILFEDNDLVVINKPPGVVVNRAQSVKDLTVQDWMEDKLQIRNPKSEIRSKVQNSSTQNNFELRDSSFEFINRGGIVHRIDKETSGVLILAKNSQSFYAIQGQFKDRTVHKTYVAIVHGNAPAEGTIDAPVDRLPWNRERFGIVPGGKESVTRYKRINVSEYQGVNDKKVTISLVEVYPETGRTHQIRVHFKYIGFPLVGDYLYAGRKTSRDDRVWAPRVMLHAWKIEFAHPATGKKLAFEAPIPDDMKRIIE